MKKLIFTGLAFLITCFAQAQLVKFGIKLGASGTTANLRKATSYEGSTSGGGYKEISVDKGSLQLGFHAGLTSRLTLGKFVVIPEAYFSSIQNEMKLTDLSTKNVSTVANSMTRLDIPVLVGVKLAKIFRVNAGPVGSVLLKQRSGVKTKLAELLSGEQIDDDPDKFSFGFQAGMGVDISKLTLDLRYESNLGWLGSGIVISNQMRSFDSRTRQIVLSLGILF
jgi:Outer membrane protein beta-barrel domain